MEIAGAGSLGYPMAVNEPSPTARARRVLKPAQLNAFALIPGRRTLAGSMIGSIKETQEMLDFCGEKNIVADIEVISIDQINAAYQRMQKSDVRYRFVIDMATL